MPNDHDELLRRAYATFTSGDVDGYLALCTPDITFTVPGSNRVAGIYSRQEFRERLIPNVMGLTNGTFREVVLDVFTSDRGGVVRAEHTFDRNGRAYDFRTLHIYDIRDGKLASFQEVAEDARIFDEAWA
ncbi:MAG TPA: nuclear transport factor 2 family protein [Thermoanaerobaculia bacterium]|nr:nuclear transport factor 2 family protein [Thermoanaerobaculia bacterium]